MFHLRYRFMSLALLTMSLIISFPFIAAANDSDEVSNQHAWKIVVLGSSTAYGTGASTYDSSWVGRFTSYVHRRNEHTQVFNLSGSGYTTYQSLRPDGYVPPVGRPTPVSGHNITAALALHPDAILINMPSNDAKYLYSMDEQNENYDAAIRLCDSANIPVWVTSSQPRNNLSQTQMSLLTQHRDMVFNRFGTKALDFWNGIANADGSIISSFNFDNTHVNNSGHLLFYNRVMAASILDSLAARLAGPFVVNAGRDIYLEMSASSATLNGSLSASGGVITSYQWNQLSGSSVIIDNSSSAITSISGLAEGQYSFELTVTDDLANIGKDTVVVFVGSRILIDFGPQFSGTPDANGRYWNNIYAMYNGVRLKNAVTTNNVTTNLGLEVLNRIDGNFNIVGPGTVNVGTPFGAIGDYVATATADYTFAQPSATNGQWKITGLEPGNSYVIKFWGAKDTLLDERSIQIKRSSDNDWQEYNAVLNTDYNNAAYFTVSGVSDVTFDIRVKAGNPFGYISLIDIYRASSHQGNISPIARAGNDANVVLPNSSTLLNGSSSTDQDGNITSYQWRKISGPVAAIFADPNAAQTTVSGLTDGVYQFELSVTDNDGAVSLDTVEITVGNRVLVDFGAVVTASPDANNNYWNHVANGRPGVKLADAINTINANTGIAMEIVNRIDGTFNTAGPGVNSGNTIGAVGDYPSSATTDYAFSHSSATNGSWKLSGLDPAKNYTVKFWGTKSSVNPNFIQIKRSDEASWKRYDASLNKDYLNAAIFNVIGNTEVSFDIRTESPYTFGYISLVDILVSNGPCLPSSSTNTINACSSYEWNGTVYTQSGTYTFNTVNARGCDSTATLDLTINQPTSSNESVVYCNSYEWNGTVYTQSGTYTFTTNNANGCDSVATLDLIINQPTSSNQSVASCNSYEWNGTVYTQSGTYTFTTNNANGCDSVATLELTINASTGSSQSIASCDSYEWNGTVYTQSGTYTFTTNNANGCDSVAILNLFINSIGTLSAGADQAVDTGVIVQLNGSYIGGSVAGYQWIGNGQFIPDITTLNAQYIPTSDEVAAGIAVLVLEANTACGIATDTVNIYLSNPTPVTDLRLSGNRIGIKNQLNWVTTNEINCHGFQLERSIDGINFSTIGQVTTSAPNGTFNGTLRYSYADNQNNGQNLYYRVRQMDNDGRSKLSNTVMIDGLKNFSETTVFIYPNPTSAILNVSVNSNRAQKIGLSVLDANGRRMIQTSGTMSTGLNWFKLNVAGMAQGVYFIQVTDEKGNNSTIGRFVKQ